MTRVLIAINEPRIADHVSGLVSESDDLELAGALRDPQELRGALPRADVDALVIHDHRGAVPLIEITRELATAHPDMGIVLIAGEDTPALLRGGMQAGARDVIAEPLGLEQLETSVMAAAAWTQALRRRAARDAGGELVGLGRVVTIVGAKGGVGTTTIAVNLALAARELSDTSVALVEYDLPAGDARAFLDLPHGRGVVDLALVAEEVTGRQLRETMYTHASGMRVLLGPQEGERAEEVSGAAARNILSAIRTRNDLTIVDAGAVMNDVTSVAVEMADTVLIVTTPDVVSLRGVVRMLALWERIRIEPPEVRVLLNRTSRKLEVQPDLVRRVAPAPLLETTVPASFFSLEPTVNTGIPTVDAASEALLRPMAAVLGEISALPAPAEDAGGDRARSIVARLVGERGQATVELAGLLLPMMLVLVVLWQLALIGATFVFDGHAARAGARAYAVGGHVKQAALQSLPGGFSHASVSAHTGSSGYYGTVTVKQQIPLLVPGASLPVTVTSSAGTVIEDELTPGETPALDVATGGGGVGVAPPLAPPLPTTGPRATPIGNGDMTAPRSAPQAVKTMIAAANQIDDIEYPDPDVHYGDLSTIWPFYDCSGSTDYVLYRAGYLAAGDDVASSQYLDTAWDAQHNIKPGQGKWVTIWAKPGDGAAGHVHLVIAGQDFDTDHEPGSGPGSGPKWLVPAPDDIGPPYSPYHPAGL